jgi:hypothetical protein
MKILQNRIKLYAFLFQLENSALYYEGNHLKNHRWMIGNSEFPSSLRENGGKVW